MKLLLKIVLRILVNALGLYLSARYITGFHFAGDLTQLLILAVILSILNLLLKPILKLILSPIIILTLGLALLFVNAIILYLLDFFSVNLTIDGVLPLIISSILFGILNLIFHLIL
jgi:putative membrane protein